MAGNHFVQSMVEDKARQRLVKEVALIESEWPAHTPAFTTTASIGATYNGCSGFAFINASLSGSGWLLMSVPSAMWFKPRTLVVDNQSAALNHLTFYEGGSASAMSGVVFQMYAEGKTTQFIGLDNITVGKDLWVQAETVGNVAIRVGGLLVPSGPEN